MRLKLIATELWSIYAPCDQNGSTFLERGELNQNELGKFRAILERMVSARQGPRIIPQDRNHQVDQRDQIYQLRIDAVRVLWFYDANRVVVCTHPYHKKSKKAPPSEIDAARRVKQEYLAAKAAGSLKIVEV